MCTVTLSYNENSALARRKLALLMASGLFTQVAEASHNEQEKVAEYRELRDAVMKASKKSMSHVIARYL